VRERWKIIDPATGNRATIVTYFTKKQAEDDIDEWLRRQERGGRKDLSREFLESLVVVQCSA
jgi:hypothetical protein